MSDSGNLIMELDNHITSVIQNFDFTDLDVSEQIEQWVMYNVNDHIETDDLKSEIINDIDLDDINEFYDLREKVEELEGKLNDRLSPAELESQIRAQGMMIEGLTNHVLELEERLKLAAEAFTKKIFNAEEVSNGVPARGRPEFTKREDDQTSDKAERSAEGEAEDRDGAECDVSG